MIHGAHKSKNGSAGTTRGVRSPAVRSRLSLLGGCTRCGRGSKHMTMPGKCTGPKYLSEKLGNGESDIDLVRRMDRKF